MPNMTDDIIDLTNTLESANSGHKNPPREEVIRFLRKFDVHLEEISPEVNILDFEIVQTQEKDQNYIFEEFESVSYRLHFVTYNVEFCIRLLTFQNDTQSQILKLDIQVKTKNIKKEVESCCNSLQRRRNLDLMFKTLIECSKFLEGRRLICELVLKKNRNIEIDQNKDGGIIIVYTDEIRNVRLGIFWSIACSSTHDVTDVIEVYYKLFELFNKNEIENKLHFLTEPCLDFTQKYHLWQSLIDNLSGRSLCVVIDKMTDVPAIPKRSSEGAQMIEVTVSDSEELQKMSEDSTRKVLPNSIKEQEVQNVIVLSDCEESSRKSVVVEIDQIPEDSIKNDLLSSSPNTINEQGVQNATVLSDSEESCKKSLVVEINKLPEESFLSSCPNSNDERRVQVVTHLSDSEESSLKPLVVKIDKMPEGTTRRSFLPCRNKKEEAVQEVTRLFDSEKLSRKSLVIKIDKLQNTSVTTGSSVHFPKNIGKEAESVLSSEDDQGDKNDVSRKLRTRIKIVSSSDSNDSTQGNKNDVSRKRRTPIKIVSSSDSNDSTVKLVTTTEIPKEILTYLQLEEVGSRKNSEPSPGKVLRSKFSKNKVVELKCSDSESVSKKSPRRKNLKGDSSSDDNATSEDDKASSGSGRQAAKKSGNKTSVRRISPSDSRSDEDDEYLPEKYLDKRKKNSLSKFSKNKIVELKCSDSEYVSKKSPMRMNLKGDSSSDKDYTSSESGNKKSVTRISTSDSSSDEDDEYLDKKKKNLISPSRMSPRARSTEEKANSVTHNSCSRVLIPRRSSRSGSRSKPVQSSVVSSTPDKQIVVRNCQQSPTKTVTTPDPNRGLLLITDPTIPDSVLPNDILGEVGTSSTPKRNLRIRHVPNASVNRTPSFLELKLLTPNKKQKFEPIKIDDDLEITSVTYIVPD